MKNFRVQIILRLILIVVNVVIISQIYSKSGFNFLIFLFAALLFLQVFLLFRYIDIVNKELTKFLQSIKYSDFSAGFNKDYLGGSFTGLNEAFRDVMKKFQEARAEKEENFRYLQTVIQHVGIGLISFNQLGDVEFFNSAAKKNLKINSLKNINQLNGTYKNLLEKFNAIKAGEKITIKINAENDLQHLFIYATEFKMRNQNVKLIAMQNIQNELEEQEMQAWQKLIRVLTHEIMNSITPISSLASTLSKMLPELKSGCDTGNTEIFEDIDSAVNTIHKRSNGLLNFVEKYRSLTRIPKPVFASVSVDQLFIRMKLLMLPSLSENNISLNTKVNPENLELYADSDLIEQVLINLLKNAIQSLGKSDSGVISLTAGIDNQGKAVIKVTDNGPGIKEDVADKIFVPFFSTKQDGSGIGLSISRQIIRAHGGSLQVSSKPNEETVFTIRL
ncbi:MAG: GHKL domain-containing protein [Ignavibacteria bacterium]|nr:GHKL domain-containing protein [Ignavibacteria bacterium]